MLSPEDLPEDLGLLARRNAIELSDSRWDTDIERLVRAIEAICNDPALEEKEQVEKFIKQLESPFGFLDNIEAIMYDDPDDDDEVDPETGF